MKGQSKKIKKKSAKEMKNQEQNIPQQISNLTDKCFSTPIEEMISQESIPSVNQPQSPQKQQLPVLSIIIDKKGSIQSPTNGKQKKSTQLKIMINQSQNEESANENIQIKPIEISKDQFIEEKQKEKTIIRQTCTTSSLKQGSEGLSLTKLLQKTGERLLEDSRGNTKVVARFRPMNELERQLQMETNCKLEFPFNNSVDVIQDGIPYTFTLDQVFPMESKQSDIFTYLGEATINDIMSGFNGTIFAYGQTGAGKTHTMMGPDIYDEELQGVIPRAVHYIFEKIKNTEIEIDFTLSCSMLEIYREQLRDLFAPDECELKIKDSPHRGIYVEGLTVNCVVDAEEMLELIETGNNNRIVAATGMNKQSSRSHSLFILEVQQKFPNGSEKKGMLNLVDLAGSEKISKSKVKGENLEEAKKINLSLSALGNVIHALTTNSDHIPYRDSKLTRLLQQSLGGNFKTSLIVACSPHPHNFDETITTLKFAQRAKNIKNKPRANINRSPAYYQKIIESLKIELAKEKQKVLALIQQLNINPDKTNQILDFAQDQDLNIRQQDKKELPKRHLSEKQNSHLKIPTKQTTFDISNQLIYNSTSNLQSSFVLESSFYQETEQFQTSIESPKSNFFKYNDQSIPFDFAQQKEMLEMQIQNLKSENSALENEISELKNEKEDQATKIENLKFKLIEAENKCLKLQTQYEQIHINLNREQENNIKLQQSEKQILNHVDKLTQFLNDQDIEVQKLIAQKAQKMINFDEISLSCLSITQQKCLTIQEALKENEQYFMLNVDDLAKCVCTNEMGNYDQMLEKEIEHGLSLEFLRYKHRQNLQEAALHNSQLIHILYAMSWRYENAKFLLNIKDLEISGLKRTIKELELTISNLSQQHKRMSRMIDSFKRLKLEQNIIHKKPAHQQAVLPKQFRMIKKIQRDAQHNQHYHQNFPSSVVKSSQFNIVENKQFSLNKPFFYGEQTPQSALLQNNFGFKQSLSINLMETPQNQQNKQVIFQDQDSWEKQSSLLANLQNQSPAHKNSDVDSQPFLSQIQNNRRTSKSKTLIGLPEMDANEVKLMLQIAKNMRLSTELTNCQQQQKILEHAFRKVSEKFEISLNQTNKNWIRHFREIKRINSNELKRKQKQIVKLHEQLSQWMNQVVIIQKLDQKHIPNSKSLQLFQSFQSMDYNNLMFNQSLTIQSDQSLKMEQKAISFLSDFDKSKISNKSLFIETGRNETDQTFLVNEMQSFDRPGFNSTSPRAKTDKFKISQAFGEQNDQSICSNIDKQDISNN